ncbi:hypothetical protein ABT095_17415 [Kitasatospora sp. NPDC002227]|uniref:hypothetical protein n=1 Tax=Kitasatospora sp. NPDC002227 TaxID=3154773 RepID=UPI003331983F
MNATLLILLATVTVLLVRSGEIRTWHAVTVGLLGVYLDRAHWTDPVIYAVTWLLTTHTP